MRAGAPPALLAVVVALACFAATAAAAPDGTQVVSWGENSVGKLANGGHSFPPSSVIGIDGLTATGASVSTDHTFVVTPDAVYAAGDGPNGGLGLGADNPSGSSTLVPIPGTAAASAVAAGGDAALVLEHDGTVLAFGHNRHLAAGVDNRVGGVGDGAAVWGPTPIAGLSGVRAVSAGLYSALALEDDGTVWAWGDSATLGSLDAVNAGNSAVPVQVRLPAGRRATAIVAGYQDSYALLDDGSVVGWGVNEYGELGDGTKTPREDPVPVSGIPTGGPHVVSIAAGWGTAFALLDDGSFLSWGANEGGQLGLGNGAADVTTPTAPNPSNAAGFPTYPSFADIVAASAATYGITTDGRVYAWGYDDSGQLGGPVTSSFPYPAGTETPALHAEIPQRVGTLKDVPWLASGSTGNHQLALTTLTLQATGDSQTRFFSQQVGSIGASHTTWVGAVGDPATVHRIRLVGPDARDFLVVGTSIATLGSDPLLPLTLADGGFPLGIDVRFAPSGLGERDATLVVESDSEVAQVPLDGFGVAPTGGPQGAAGPAGPPGANGSAGRDGANGKNGRNGKDGVVKLAVTSSTVRLKRGKTAALHVTVRNSSGYRLPRASVSLRLPRALGAGPTKAVVLKALAKGAQRSVSLPLHVRANAVPGHYRVTVRLVLGSKRFTRVVAVRVVR
jgi:alpha-tubulin suppressor-like RCC1 family protein